MSLIILDKIIAISIAYGIALYSVKNPFQWELFDYPNSRSLHGHPIPCTGGIAILGGIIVSNLVSIQDVHIIITWPPIPFFIMGLMPLMFIALLDDSQGVATYWRIITHLLASVSLLIAGLSLEKMELPGLSWPLSPWVDIPLTLLLTIWMINLYNFMDGMDGFAGGMAVIGFSALAWLGRADADFASFCLIVAAASAGFLVHNFPPAKIFMGDTGSTTLGFLVAACCLWGNKAGLFPLWAALLVFSPFIVDATVTLLCRLFRGEKIWEAHRSHYYQRLVLLGWGHRRTVLAEYVLMLTCAGSAIGAVALPPSGQLILLMAWVVIYLLLMWAVERLEQRHVTVPAP